MKTTYKGNTYQTLVDTTGDVGMSSFSIPITKDNDELINFIASSGYMDNDDEIKWNDDELVEGEEVYIRIPSWCKLSSTTPEMNVTYHPDGEVDIEFHQDVDDDYDYFDWIQTTETLYDHQPEDYDALMYLTSLQFEEGNEYHGEITKEDYLESILPLIKQLYKFCGSIDN